MTQKGKGSRRAKPRFVPVWAHPDIENGTRRVIQPGAWVCGRNDATCIVVHVPGFGGDNCDAYAKALTAKVADEFGAIAVSVRYHCYQVRHEYMERAELECTAPKTFLLKTLEPQNFGVIQALDVLAATAKLRRLNPSLPVLAVGSSHGGYVAMLANKFSPGAFSAILACSAYVRTVKPLATDIGSYTANVQTSDNEMHKFWVRVPSAWGDGSLLTEGRLGIRNLCKGVADNEAGLRQTTYTFLHSESDELAPVGETGMLVNKLRDSGIQAHMYLAKHADGKLIKTLAHGMDISIFEALREFWDRLPRQRTYPTKSEYLCGEFTYRFRPTGKGTVGECVGG